MWSRGAPFGMFLGGNWWSSSFAYLFRRRPAGRGPGWLVGWWHLFFSVPRSPRKKFHPWVPVIFFFVCKPVVVGGRAEQENLK